MDLLQEPWDWGRFLEPLLKLAGAFLLALPIAWERERSTRIMGLRTFSLVAVASCGYVLIAARVVGLDADPQARIRIGSAPRSDRQAICKEESGRWKLLFLPIPR